MMPLGEHLEATDSLHYILPPGLELHGATLFFSQFGEVRNLELVPGDELTIAVVFYDVRSAALALSTLGGDQCWPMPKQGVFEAKLPGSSYVPLQDVQGIANVRVDMENEENFILEFYDIRVAELMSHRNERREQTARDWGLCQTRPQRPVPAFVKATSLIEEAQPVATCEENGSLLANLAIAYKVVLQQAGLLELTTSFEAWQGELDGEAFVHFMDNPGAAEKCCRHFNSCKWEGQGAGCIARLVDDEETAEKVSARRVSVTDQASNSVTKPSGGPARPGLQRPKIDAPPGLEEVAYVRPRSRGGSAGSAAEQSTEAGTSEPGEEVHEAE
eukprot:TRINITY_DN18826_c0_g1_i1.p1 TRINITY_DN18826_c0_g1~~TRINITY_DN18826_c0_g1_i1.p1  ORF type:complete len:331 (+),score=85.18 TRINITY_DN18826_c0_g1_i1:117-1109(+)